jgi:hypothetical protein
MLLRGDSHTDAGEALAHQVLGAKLGFCSTCRPSIAADPEMLTIERQPQNTTNDVD